MAEAHAGKDGGREVFPDNFSGESARQVVTPGAAGERELAESFDLGEIQRKAVRTAETTQDAPLQSERLRMQKLQFDAALKPGVGTQEVRTKDGGDQLIEEGIFGGGDFGGLAERLPQLRVVVALQPWQQAVAHAVAEKARVEVGGVVAKRLAERA